MNKRDEETFTLLTERFDELNEEVKEATREDAEIRRRAIESGRELRRLKDLRFAIAGVIDALEEDA